MISTWGAGPNLLRTVLILFNSVILLTVGLMYYKYINNDNNVNGVLGSTRKPTGFVVVDTHYTSEIKLLPQN